MDGTVAAAKEPLIDFVAAIGSAFRVARPFAALGTASGLAVSPFLLLGRDDGVRQHPDAVRRLLCAESVARDEAATVISRA